MHRKDPLSFLENDEYNEEPIDTVTKQAYARFTRIIGGLETQATHASTIIYEAECLLTAINESLLIKDKVTTKRELSEKILLIVKKLNQAMEILDEPIQ